MPTYNFDYDFTDKDFEIEAVERRYITDAEIEAIKKIDLGASQSWKTPYGKYPAIVEGSVRSEQYTAQDPIGYVARIGFGGFWGVGALQLFVVEHGGDVVRLICEDYSQTEDILYKLIASDVNTVIDLKHHYLNLRTKKDYIDEALRNIRSFIAPGDE